MFWKTSRDRMIETRLRQIIVDCRLAWTKQINELQAKMSNENTFGGSPSLFAGMEVFHRCLDDATSLALKELGENFETRNARWHKYHDLFANLIKDETADIPVLNARKMTYGYPNGAEGLTENAYSMAISGAMARVYRHQAGWSAPKPRPWYERHRFILGVLGGAAIYLAGLYTDEIKLMLQDLATTNHQSSPGTQSGSGAASPKRPADTPAS